MFVVQAMLTLLSRYAGRVLNTLFGWATRMLFGKVPQERQVFLSLMSFGAVLWLIVALGIAFPRFGVFVLSFVRLPAWIDETWIRVGMLAGTAVVPLFIGWIALLMMDPADRPTDGKGKAKAVLKGYPYAAGLSLTLLWMIVFAPVMKVRDAFRHWTSTHVQILIDQEDYDAVIDDLQRAMAGAGLPLHVEQASWQVSVPTRIMAAFSGGGVFRKLMAQKLLVLASSNLEVMLLPFDLIVRGDAEAVGRVRAVLAGQLSIAGARMTWTKEANDLEDRLAALFAELKGCSQDGPLDPLFHEIRAWEADLKDNNLPYEEWEILFRKKLLLEKEMLSAAMTAHGRQRLQEDTIAMSARTGSAGADSRSWH